MTTIEITDTKVRSQPNNEDETVSSSDSKPATGTEIPTISLIPNPANPRHDLGDLTEMVRSVKVHGILQPLLILPKGKNGRHLIVAGHRRRAAAQMAGLETVPVVIRHLTDAEVLEVMLIENGNREDLTLSEEIGTLKALMALDVGYTPRKLCTRIGKSQRWIKDRLAVTILPTRWLDQLDTGHLTLAAAVAASSLADLGPENVDTMCAKFTSGNHWRDPTTDVDMYRKDLQTKRDADALVAKLESKGITVYSSDIPVPSSSRSLHSMSFEVEQAKAHESEPCHAVEVRPGYNAGPRLNPFCVEPRRHHGSKAKPAKSEIVAPAPGGHSETEAAQQTARRKARVARLTAGTDLFARASKKPRVDDLRDMALTTLIINTGEGAKKHALKILGIKLHKDETPTGLLAVAAAESPKALVRVAGAVACGIAEDSAYHSTSDTVIDYMSFLIRNGWEPDDTTANILVRHKG